MEESIILPCGESTTKKYKSAIIQTNAPALFFRLPFCAFYDETMRGFDYCIYLDLSV